MKLSETSFARSAVQTRYCSKRGGGVPAHPEQAMRRWLIQQMESTRNRPSFDASKSAWCLEDLSARRSSSTGHAHGLHRAEAILPGGGPRS